LSVSTALIARAYNREARQRALASDAVESLMDRMVPVVSKLADSGALTQVAEFREYAAELSETLPEDLRNSPRHRARLALISLHHGRCAVWWHMSSTAEEALTSAIAVFESLPQFVFEKLPSEVRGVYEPVLPFCYFYLGESRLEDKRVAAAKGCYRKCLELLNKPAIGHEQIDDLNELRLRAREATEQARKGALDRRINGLRTRINEVPNDARLHEELAKAYTESGRFDEAIEQYTRAIGLDPSSFQLYFARGDVCFRIGDVELAIRNWTELIERDPTFAHAYAFRGYVNFEKGDFRSSLEDYNMAIKLNPTSPKSHAFQGYIHSLEGNYGEAVECYKRAIQLSSAYADPLVLLGDAHREMGEKELAMANYDESIRIDSTLAFGYCHRALARAEWGDMEGALDDLEMAANSAERQTGYATESRLHLVAWFFANCPDRRLRQPTKAIEFATQLVQMRPRAGHMWAILGAAEYRAGKFAEALESLEKSAESPSCRQTASCFFLAMTHWQLGNKEAARRAYARGVELMEQHLPYVEREHARFRAEAAALLGVAKRPSTETEVPPES
ncbi:MAG: tetratricopeptide repeat protein, partial [Gemmatimonadota bacterium]